MNVNGACSIVLPVDGSDNSLRAVRLVIRLHAKLALLSVRLLHVRLPLMPVGGESGGTDLAEAATEETLTSATALLDAASVPYTSAIANGYVGSTIVAYAREHGCDGIVMGTRGMGSTEELLGSIARQVIHLADLPVTLVK